MLVYIYIHSMCVCVCVCVIDVCAWRLFVLLCSEKLEYGVEISFSNVDCVVVVSPEAFGIAQSMVDWWEGIIGGGNSVSVLYLLYCSSASPAL